MLAKPQAFYNAMRMGLLGPSLSQSEVDGCDAILEACDGWPLAWTAYAGATAYHETAHTMLPIKEFGGEAYFRRRYDLSGDNPALARRLGNTQVGDGAKYAGRGYVQLTGRANYAKAQAETHHNLVANPDLAMRPDVAALILRAGMSEGWFTGKRLMTFLPSHGAADRTAFVKARAIINGSDKAGLIADYAVKFQDALALGGWS